MSSMPLIAMLLKFSILIISINLIWCVVTKNITKSDIQRIGGSAFCICSSGLMIYFEETFAPSLNYIGSNLSSHLGLSMSEIALCILGIFIIIAFFKTIFSY